MDSNKQLKVLVTGAGGYIGRYVCSALKEKGCYVIAADIRASDSLCADAQKVCDIFSGDKDMFEKLERPDVLVHMAWLDGFKHNSFRHLEYLPKHIDFIRTMLDGGLKRVAVMGTMHEIGYYEGEINEDTPANPLSYYGIAKNALRQALGVLINSYEGAVLQWLRAYYIIGDDINGNSIFSKIVKAENEGKELFPFTSGKNKYDFISIEELAEQISSAAVQDKINGVINCCSGNPVSLAERVEKFIRDNGFKIRLQYGAFPDRPYDSPGIWGNTDKIKAIMKGND